MVERIARGAFKSVLDNGEDVIALFNHDMNNVLGRRSAGTLDLAEDDTGLRYRIEPPDTDFGRRIIESVRRGDVPDSSFGFIPDRIEYDRDKGKDVRVVRSVERLVDVGPVTLGAYSGTTAESRSIVASRARVLRGLRNIHKGNTTNGK